MQLDCFERKWFGTRSFAALVKSTWAIAEDYKWTVGATSTQYVARVTNIPLHVDKSCDVDTIENTGQIRSDRTGTSGDVQFPLCIAELYGCRNDRLMMSTSVSLSFVSLCPVDLHTLHTHCAVK